MNGNVDELDTVLCEAAFSPLIGSCYRLILTKIIQIIAFKQSNEISSRCWRLIRALCSNTRVRDVDCREEYYHLAEILVCQLLAPLESIKIQTNLTKTEDSIEQRTIKMEMDSAVDFGDNNAALTSLADQGINVTSAETDNVEKIFKLEPDHDEEMTSFCNDSSPDIQTSQYFATPVEWDFVDELCETLGMLGALNGYFQSECLFHIIRRLKRFFKGRIIEKERGMYGYIFIVEWYNF